jgi:dTDP-4-dehydrorhamnose reductase
VAKKILIFGGGFVGLNLASVAIQSGWESNIADCLERQHDPSIKWFICDITNRNETEKLVCDIKPDLVVNVAALADIDKAEKDKELAYRINVEGAINAAQASKNINAKYIYFSSDAVFSGKDSSYNETDITAPVNYYGLTKAQAEEKILKLYKQSIIVRISLVLGYSVSGGNSFFESLEKKLESGAEILCSTKEVRTPVDVYTLCDCILGLSENDFSGIFNIGASNHINRFELTVKIARILGFNEKQVVKETLTSSANSGRAPRHENGILSVSKIEKALNFKMPDVDEVIKRALIRKY